MHVLVSLLLLNIVVNNICFFHFTGDFVIVDPIEEGDKVKGEICVILFPKQIKFIKKEGFW